MRLLGMLVFCAALGSHSFGWQPIVLSTSLDQGVLPSEEVSRAFLKVGLRPIWPAVQSDRAPIELAIVIDRSGSMSGAKIETAKHAALEAISALQSHDRVCLVTYSSDVETVIPLQRVDCIGDVMSAISKIRSDGNTAIFAGVNQAAAELRRSDEKGKRFRRILLLSDGLANVGPSQPADFARLGRALSLEGVSVSTVGLGSGYNEDLMTQLSVAGEGNAYFAESHRDLPRIFEAELGDATIVVAQQVQVEIECADGFRPLRFLGRPGRIEGNKAIFEIGQLYGGQEKFALIEVECRGGLSESRAQVASVNAVYHHLKSEHQGSLRGEATVAFSAKKEVVARSVDLEVKRSVVVNQIADAKDQAIALADSGGAKAAAKKMSEVAASINASNAEWKDEKIASEALAFAAEASAVDSSGLNNQQRKEMRSDWYNSTRQQKKY